MRTKEILSASLLLLSLVFVYSCSNEESPDFLEGNMKTILPTTLDSKVISKSEIPEGSKIVVVDNEEQDKALTKKLENEKVLFVFYAEDYAAEKGKNANLLRSLERMATPENGSVAGGWYVAIKAKLIYYGPLDPITVKSTAYIVGESGYFLKSWTQTASSASWTSSFTAINYYVAGTAVLTCFVYNSQKKEYEERTISRNVSYSGIQYI